MKVPLPPAERDDVGAAVQPQPHQGRSTAAPDNSNPALCASLDPQRNNLCRQLTVVNSALYHFNVAHRVLYKNFVAARVDLWGACFHELEGEIAARMRLRGDGRRAMAYRKSAVASAKPFAARSMAHGQCMSDARSSGAAFVVFQQTAEALVADEVAR